MSPIAIYVAVAMPPIWFIVGREILRAWREVETK